MVALLCLCIVLLVWCFLPRKAPTMPGPRPWPLIGSMHIFAAYERPFEAFTALSRIYGDIFAIHLGATPCVVVNTFKLIKEVLITKGADFGGRPDFARFHRLFGGDRNNSLALCDWSSLQKTRRSIARIYCSPRFTSLQYDNIGHVGESQLAGFLKQLDGLADGQPRAIKPTIQLFCANMFSTYMCSTSFDYEDQQFRKVVRYFDQIFWEINQGYAVDFLPWLLPVYSTHMRRLSHWATEIRGFILERIIDDRRANLDLNAQPRDFTDALLIHLEEDPNMNWQHIIFELEDFLGGHSAIGNLVMVTLAAILKNPIVAKTIQEEIDQVTGGTRAPNLFDKPQMPYTEATIWETLRTASSPIVPHVASTDTCIDGHKVKKGTIVFINNYELNQSESLWEKPEQFNPNRFLSATGQLTKPAHFIPFSTGKRTCIGQRLVLCFSFIVLTTMLQRYDISTNEEVKVPPGCLAVPPDCFKVILTHRKCC